MGIIKKMIKTITKPAVNNIKGKAGERKVNRELNPLIFGKVEHKQINDLILIDERGKSHQLDHIEIRQNGIFCIETKNYKGWIYGSKEQEKWTQVLYNEKNQFFSPLKQNNSHIYHLSKALDNKYKINSLIVFVQNNADKIDEPNVINLNQLSHYLNKFNDGTNYTLEEMNEIYNLILSSSNNEMTTKQHIQNIKETQKELKQNICPRCGSKLIERNGQYGKFLGCSNYPNCKFKK